MEKPVEGAILFADVSGSTKLYDTVGDRLAYAAVQACVQVFKDMTTARGGHVVKTIGDEVMAFFPDGNAAAAAAMDMQKETDALDPPPGGARLGARIGFHAGPAIERDGDYFGDSVNLAARLSDVAIRGQVITSRATADRLNPVLRAACRPLHSTPLKGKGEVEICELLWQDTEQTVTVYAPTVVVPAPARALRLSYGGREIVLDSGRPTLGFGRDKGAELVVEDANASRSHGRFELRAGKFFVVDHSVNGTYITLEGMAEFVLRREEHALFGRGTIAFGQPTAKAGAPLVFEVN